MSDFEAMVRAALHISSSQDQEAMARNILEAAREVLETEAASLMLVDSERLKWLAALGSAGAVLVNQDLDLGEGIAGWVASSGETVVANDAPTDQRFCDRIDALSGFTTRAILCVPLVASGRVIGVLELINRPEGEFDGQDARKAQAFASLAAVALENARLIRMAEEIGNLREITRFKNEMISVVAQELRAPLTTIRGFSEMALDERGVEPEDARRFTSLVLDETRRMERIIEDLLRLGRIESGPLKEEEVALAPVLRACAERRATESHPIRVSGEGTAMADAAALSQVMDELLENAVLYSPGGGAIDVTVRPASGVVRVEVRDHGLGVPSDAVPRLYHHFFRVAGPKRPAGTGLGLTIARTLVTRMGGDMGCEPASPGTTFWFTVPSA